MEDPAPPPYSAPKSNEGSSQGLPHGEASIIERSYQPDKKSLPETNNDYENSLILSGATHFALRPPPSRLVNDTLVFRLLLLQKANIDELKMPGRKEIWKDRDITRKTWSAFLKHLTLLSADKVQRIHIDERQTASEQEASRRSRLEGVAANRNHGFFNSRGLDLILEIEPCPSRIMPMKKQHKTR